MWVRSSSLLLNTRIIWDFLNNIFIRRVMNLQMNHCCCLILLGLVFSVLFFFSFFIKIAVPTSKTQYWPNLSWHKGLGQAFPEKEIIIDKIFQCLPLCLWKKNNNNTNGIFSVLYILVSHILVKHMQDIRQIMLSWPLSAFGKK